MTREQFEILLEAEHRLATFHEGGFSFASMCGRGERLVRLADPPRFGVVEHGLSVHQVVAELIARWWWDGDIMQDVVPGGAGRKAYVFTVGNEEYCEGVGLARRSHRLVPHDTPPQLTVAIRARLTRLCSDGPVIYATPRIQ